jgi:hypothetical protein
MRDQMRKLQKLVNKKRREIDEQAKKNVEASNEF